MHDASPSTPLINIPFSNNDILTHICGFIGAGEFFFVANIDTKFHRAYKLHLQAQHEQSMFATSAESVAASVSRLQLAWTEWLLDDDRTTCRNHGLEVLYPAIANDNLAVAQWLMHPEQNRVLQFTHRDHHHIRLRAAENGHLGVLQQTADLPGAADLQNERRICQIAAENGHLLILQYAKENNWSWRDNTVWRAALGGHLHVLQWALANGCPWDERICCCAASRGHLHIIQWAQANGCPSNEEICWGAASGGRLHILEWARANGCPWDKTTCWGAASSGHLHILQWARSNGCPWDATTCWGAASGGHLHILQWARANGCPWDEATCWGAASGGHLHILQWARANGCPE